MTELRYAHFAHRTWIKWARSRSISQKYSMGPKVSLAIDPCISDLVATSNRRIARDLSQNNDSPTDGIKLYQCYWSIVLSAKAFLVIFRGRNASPRHLNYYRLQPVVVEVRVCSLVVSKFMFWVKSLLGSYIRQFLIVVTLLCSAHTECVSQHVEICWERLIDSCENVQVKSVGAGHGLIYVLASCRGEDGVSSWDLTCLDSAGIIQWHYTPRMTVEQFYGKVIVTSVGTCRVYWASRRGELLTLYCSSFDRQGNEVSIVQVSEGLLSISCIDEVGNNPYFLVSQRNTDSKDSTTDAIVFKWNTDTGIEWSISLKQYLAVGLKIKAIDDEGCIVSGRSTFKDDGELILVRIHPNSKIIWRKIFSFNTSFAGQDMEVIDRNNVIVFGGSLPSSLEYPSGFVLFSLNPHVRYTNWVATYKQFALPPLAGMRLLYDKSMIIVSGWLNICRINRFGDVVSYSKTISDESYYCDGVAVLDDLHLVLVGTKCVNSSGDTYLCHVFVRKYQMQ